MNKQLKRCPKCLKDLTNENLSAEIDYCPKCNVGLDIYIFSAAFRDNKVESAAAIPEDGGASCFYHEEKKAELLCDRCGKFICLLCDINLGDQHVCPNCLQYNVKEDGEDFVKQRTLYHKLSLFFAVLSMCGGITVIPALYYSIRYFKADGGLVNPRSGWHATCHCITFLVALVWICIWGYWGLIVLLEMLKG
ncbi:MAG: hypothetical protein HRT89_14690 [Lentisphaeria bacterium]|nr:B-box zinc finger protein [Lentisphaeria bacterium]NQZ69306.1 hypothetical protein [Lentisphaeria bacterium]